MVDSNFGEIETDQLFRTDAEIQLLHVDYNSDFALLVAEKLEQIDPDITVQTETDPNDALDRIKAGSVDCVVSSYDMPQMDGVEFLNEVRAIHPSIPFILFTNNGSEKLARRALDAGATGYRRIGGTKTFRLLANQVRMSVDHRRSQQVTQVLRDRLFGLYEKGDGFYTLAEDWTITDWNGEMESRTGRDAEEVVGQSFWDVFPLKSDDEIYERFSEAMELGESVRFEVYFEPSECWADIRAAPVEDGLFVHSRDISAIIEREQEMERRNQILESFAHTVSHDLRNPLQVAEGRLAIAQETGDLEHLDEVARAHNRMQNLIEELLSIARGEDTTVTTVSLYDSATQAWKTVSADGIELVVCDDVMFEADKSQLRRVFENLYWNAVEHANPDRVRVGQLDTNGFYVEDDGVGIPLSERENVFEAGYSTDVDGTGYGLHIVESLIERHGWTIEVSESDEGGARFEIRGCTISEGDM